MGTSQQSEPYLHSLSFSLLVFVVLQKLSCVFIREIIVYCGVRVSHRLTIKGVLMELCTAGLYENNINFPKPQTLESHKPHKCISYTIISQERNKRSQETGCVSTADPGPVEIPQFIRKVTAKLEMKLSGNKAASSSHWPAGIKKRPIKRVVSCRTTEPQNESSPGARFGDGR